MVIDDVQAQSIIEALKGLKVAVEALKTVKPSGWDIGVVIATFMCSLANMVFVYRIFSWQRQQKAQDDRKAWARRFNDQFGTNIFKE